MKDKTLKLVVSNDKPETGQLDLADQTVHPIPKVGWKGPNDGDWLSPMICGTEFKCRDKTGRQPRWLVNEFTHCGKLKGDVLLAPTVTIEDARSWFWVEPIEFCKQWEFRGVIEIPGETSE